MVDAHRARDYAGPFRARAGDDPAWASPDYDDSDWGEVDPFVRWEDDARLRGATVVWYRARASVRSADELAVAASALGAWDLYVDGERVARAGRPGLWFAPLAPVAALVPREALRDGEIELAIRVWAPAAYQLHGGRFDGFMLGPPDLLSFALQARDGQLLRDGLPTWLTAALAWLVGLVHLRLWAARRSLEAYRWFALGALGIGTQMALWRAATEAWVPFPPQMVFVSNALLALGVWGLLRFTAAFFGGEARAANGLAALVTLQGLGSALNVDTTRLVGLLLVAGTLPSAVWVVRTVSTALRRGDPGARAVAGGALWFLGWPAVLVALRFGWLPDGAEPWINVSVAVFQAGLLLAMVLALAERFAASHTELEAAHAATRRFVPYEFLRRLGRERITDVRRGDAVQTEMTVLFLDVRGFTTIAERLGPERTFRFVNALWEHMEPHVLGHGGFVNQFLGDGFVALFGDPDAAVRSAIALVRALDTFDARSLVGEDVAVGIGVHTGTVMLGTIGGADHLASAVVADTVNLTSRVEGMTKVYGARVLVSGATAERLGDPSAFSLREVDRVVAKGRKEPIAVHEVLDAEPEDVRHRRRTAMSAFRAAVDAYRRGGFVDAGAAFAGMADDPAAALLAARCRALSERPPADWDGVWRLDTK